MVFVAGSIYVIGGRDASGAPTKTVFSLSPDSQTGALGEWSTVDTLALPDARSGAAAAITPDGLLLVGGRNADGPVATTFKTLLNSQGALGAWSQEQSLNTPQADATAVLVGDYLWLYGGSDANGPTATVQRGAFGQAAAEGLPANPDVGKLIRWDVNASANLPAPRTNASGWAANGAIYLAGGNDGGGPQTELYWAVPTNAGDLPEWKHLAVSDLPAPLEGGAPVISGPEAVIVGGVTARLRRAGRHHRAGPSGSAPWQAHRPARERRTDRARRGERGRDQRPGQHLTAQPVLPARPGRGDRARHDDRGRDRPAARLSQRGRGRHGRLHPADPHRRRVRPQGPDAGALRPASSTARPQTRAAEAESPSPSAGEVALARLERTATDRQSGTSPTRPSRPPR